MMVTVLGLYVLAIMDAAFSGICAASGRNALIEKRGYYLRSMWHGLLVGQFVSLVALAFIAAVVLLSSNRLQTIAEMLAVADRLLAVYGAYAAVVLGTFMVRSIPSVDVRSITSTIAFGPLTILRPPIIVVGVVYGLLLRPQPPVVVVTIGVALMMMPFRALLNAVFARMSCYIHPIGS